MTDGRLIVINGAIVTFDPANPAMSPGRVVMEAGNVVSVDEGAGLPKGAAEGKGTAVVDAGGRYVLPGLVCGHHHFYSALARGFTPPGKAARNFQGVLDSLWWPLDRALTIEDAAVSARVFALDCLSRGVTTVFDHHESQSAQRGSLAAIAAAVSAAGIRACLCIGVSDRYGKGAEAIEETAAFASDAALPPLVEAAAGLHASFTVEDSTLQAVGDLCRKLGLGLHAHLSEDKGDNEASVKKYGKRPLKRLADAGLLGRKTLLAHGVHLDTAEMGLAASSAAAIVHNPESNMNNGVGLAPVRATLGAGVAVGLGTDGMSSDVISQARAAFLIRRHVACDPSAGFDDSWKMLSVCNPEIASRFFGEGTGILRKGSPADLAVMDALPPSPLTPRNAAGHVLFGLSGARARDVVCAGRIVRQDGRTLTLDEAAVAEEARGRAKALWARLSP